VGGYGTILVLFVIAAAIGGILHGLATWIGPRAPNPIKAQPFECGNIPAGPQSPVKHRLSVKFYIVALLFILFDMEAVFLFPWAVVFRELGWAGFYSMITFAAVLALGLVYVWKKGALDWE
jgi:NADH-quinone oxidoreductase subunit A